MGTRPGTDMIMGMLMIMITITPPTIITPTTIPPAATCRWRSR